MDFVMWFLGLLVTLVIAFVICYCASFLGVKALIWVNKRHARK